MTKYVYALCALILCVALTAGAEEPFRFAVIGDAGTGSSAEYQTAQQLFKEWQKRHFFITLMVGDNLYGSEGPKAITEKFEKPFASLLQQGVKFHASLGNHDDPAIQTAYAGFNMGGRRYYTFKPQDGIRFYALDSNYIDGKQLEWLEKELKASGSDWKIVFFHHPMYSSGERHGPSLDVRKAFEPLFVKYGVDVVFTGHEHFYERIDPQKKVQHFIVGSSGKLRKDNIEKNSPITAKGFDRDNTFLIAEIAGDQMTFEVYSRKGQKVDSGTILRRELKPSQPPATKPAPKPAPKPATKPAPKPAR